MAFLDIHSEHHLLGAIEYIEKEQKIDIITRISVVYQHFPFTQLVNCSAMAYESIEYLLKLFNYFLDNNEFMSNTKKSLQCTIDFVLKHVTFLIKTENEILLPLLELLGNIFSRFKYLPDDKRCSINIERIGELLLSLFTSLQSNAIKCEGSRLLVEIMTVPKIVLESSETILNCVNQSLSLLNEDKPLDLCKLVQGILRFMPYIISQDHYVLYWLEVRCAELFDKCTEVLVLYEILKCLLLSYETNYIDHLKLSKIYVKKINVFCELMQNPSLGENSSQVLIHIIKDMSCLGVLPRMEHDRLFTSELESLKHVRNIYLSDKNLVLVIIYLQYVNEVLTLNEKEILKQIIRRCDNERIYTLPVLKALCLLYPLFVVNSGYNDTKMIGNGVLRSITNSRHFPQLITYNPDQLMWFLKRGNIVLKLKSLYLWLQNYKHDKIILAVLDACKGGQLLVDFVVNVRDDLTSIPKRAADLLRILKSPALAKTLMQNIPRCTNIGFLLEAGPSLPNTEEEGLFYCKILARKLPYLHEKLAFIGGCHYSVKLLIWLIKYPRALLQFCLNTECVRKIASVAAVADDSLAIWAIRLLKTFMKLQRLHRSEVSETTQLEFTDLLQGSAERILNSLKLLQMMLVPRVAKPVVGLSRTSSLSLYQYLQSLENEQATAKLYETLTLYIQVEKHLANSAVTPLFIKMRCRRRANEHTPSFLLFLKQWLAIVRSRHSWRVPLSDIQKYVRRLRHSYEVDDVNELLKQVAISRLGDRAGH